VGFDYRFPGTPWHVNAQGRGGQSKGSDSAGSSFNNISSIVIPGAAGGSELISVNGIANTSVGLTETHWQADFGMGYDFIPRMMQINFGFRVAEVTAVTTAASNASATELLSINAPPGFVGTLNGTATASDLTTVRRSFLGAGPRVGLEGSVPVIGALAFDYSGNAALLFGNTKITSDSNSGFGSATSASITASTLFTGVFSSASSQAGLLANSNWSSQIVVYNFDVQGGFSYWFTQNWKLALSYRLDAFLNALRMTAPRALSGPVARSIGSTTAPRLL
jgi:hypothetical protein